jgi:hypothetical protein
MATHTKITVVRGDTSPPSSLDIRWPLTRRFVISITQSSYDFQNPQSLRFGETQPFSFSRLRGSHTFEGVILSSIDQQQIQHVLIIASYELRATHVMDSSTFTSGSIASVLEKKKLALDIIEFSRPQAEKQGTLLRVKDDGLDAVDTWVD